METEGIQYRTFDIKTHPSGENDGAESFVVEGHAATFGEPYLLAKTDRFEFYEQIDSRAFDGAEMDDVIFQYDHEGRVFARQSNGTLEIRPDGKGLFIRADLGGTEEGRRLYSDIKGGYITKMSFSFSVLEEETQEKRDMVNGKTVFTRTVMAVERVYDVSAVSIPANSGTDIAARLAQEKLAALEMAEVVRREREKDARERFAFEVSLEIEKGEM